MSRTGASRIQASALAMTWTTLNRAMAFAVEAAVFDSELGSEYTHENTEQGIREYPAPVNASVENSIT